MLVKRVMRHKFMVSLGGGRALCPGRSGRLPWVLVRSPKRDKTYFHSEPHIRKDSFGGFQSNECPLAYLRFSNSSSPFHARFPGGLPTGPRTVVRARLTRGRRFSKRFASGSKQRSTWLPPLSSNSYLKESALL